MKTYSHNLYRRNKKHHDPFCLLKFIHIDIQLNNSARSPMIINLKRYNNVSVHKWLTQSRNEERRTMHMEQTNFLSWKHTKSPPEQRHRLVHRLPHRHVHCAAASHRHQRTKLKSTAESRQRRESRKQIFRRTGQKRRHSGRRWRLIRRIWAQNSSKFEFPLGREEKSALVGCGNLGIEWGKIHGMNDLIFSTASAIYFFNKLK